MSHEMLRERFKHIIKTVADKYCNIDCRFRHYGDPGYCRLFREEMKMAPPKGLYYPEMEYRLQKCLDESIEDMDEYVLEEIPPDELS